MSFLSEPPPNAGQAALYKEDLDEDGFVWDATRLWSHQPKVWENLGQLFTLAADTAGLSQRDKAMLVLGTASTVGDSYCSTAWGRFLSEWADAETARAALERDDAGLTDRERVLAAWARQIAHDPNATTPDHVQELRNVGFDEQQVLALTLYAALRLAFSITNDALGAQPDWRSQRCSIPRSARRSRGEGSRPKFDSTGCRADTERRLLRVQLRPTEAPVTGITYTQRADSHACKSAFSGVRGAAHG